MESIPLTIADKFPRLSKFLNAPLLGMRVVEIVDEACISSRATRR